MYGHIHVSIHTCTLLFASWTHGHFGLAVSSGFTLVISVDIEHIDIITFNLSLFAKIYLISGLDVFMALPQWFPTSSLLLEL
jgi:hypothetical protein